MVNCGVFTGEQRPFDDALDDVYRRRSTTTCQRRDLPQPGSDADYLETGH